MRGFEPRNCRVYIAMALGVDRMIGQIMKVIESKEWSDQTLVVSSANNGSVYRGRCYQWNASRRERNRTKPLNFQAPSAWGQVHPSN